MSPATTSLGAASEAGSAHGTVPTAHESETTTPPRRRHRGRIVVLVLLVIAILFQFNPLHPITWWRQTVDNFHQGEDAAERDKAESAAHTRRKAQQEQIQNAQHPVPSSTASAPR